MIIINLKNYIKEVEAMTKVAADFISPDSQSRLHDFVEDLRSAHERGEESFPWKTSKPIVTVPSRNYDGKTHPRNAAHLEFQFKSVLQRKARGSADWKLDEMTTRICIVDSSEMKKLLSIHIDLKSPNQWGPEVHFQVAEGHAGGLAVPRVPFGFLLPTDCLDFALAELFPEKWKAAQTTAYDMSRLRKGQLDRIKAIGENILSLWDKQTKRTPVCVLQDHSFDGDLRFA